MSESETHPGLFLVDLASSTLYFRHNVDGSAGYNCII